MVYKSSGKDVYKRQVEYYTIKSGDTLSSIAKQFLGNASAYNQIFEANREVIRDPDKIFVGQKIRIPLGLSLIHIFPMIRSFLLERRLPPLRNGTA